MGCRQTLAKRSLIRVVRTPAGLKVDPTGKLAGRGAYLHDRRSCLESGLKGALAHALKVELTDQDREMMRAFMATLPADENPADSDLLVTAPAGSAPAEKQPAQGQADNKHSAQTGRDEPLGKTL